MILSTLLVDFSRTKAWINCLKYNLALPRLKLLIDVLIT